MAVQSGVFVLQGEDSLVGLEPAEFAKEDDFQRLLSRFPELLVGDQIDPENPRRWVLVKREQSVATGELGASQWSIDHLFLDQDGVPTLVEIKRQSDTRIRREVVGQMLDYAANCAKFWSVDLLQSSLEKTCLEQGSSMDSAMAGLIGPDASVPDFWQRVQRNLQTGTIRLLFVADVIPIELRRIVEFLNNQMVRAEVLAIELRQFAKDNLKTIVPTVYGQTQEAAAQKRGGGTRVWDEEALFENLAARVSEQELTIAREIYDWMRKGGTRDVVFGSGQASGSVYPLFKPEGVRINPVYLSSSGKLYVQFGALQNKPVFGSVEARRQLMDQFKTIANVSLSEADIGKYPGIPLKTIAADPAGLKKVLAALQWMENRIANLDLK